MNYLYLILSVVALSTLSGCGTSLPACSDSEGCNYYVISKYNESGHLDTDFDSDGFLFPESRTESRGIGVHTFEEIFLDSQSLIWFIESYIIQGPSLTDNNRVGYHLYNPGGSESVDVPPEPQETYETHLPDGNTSYARYSSREIHDGRELKRSSNNRGVLNEMLFCLSVDLPRPRETPLSCSIINPLTGFDTTFAGSGWLEIDLNEDPSAPRIALHWKDDYIYLAADTDDNDLSLMKFSDRGVAISTFGASGKVAVPYDPPTFQYKQAYEIDVDSRDRVLVLYGGRDPNFVKLARFLPSGDLDTSFADSGILDITGIGDTSGMFVTSEMIIQPDNKILVSRRDVIKRFNEDGTPDNSFGFFGSMLMPRQSDGGRSLITSIQLDKLSRIYVLAGEFFRGEGAQQIYRLTTSGGADSTYPLGSHLNYETAIGTERGQIVAFAVDTNSSTRPNVYVLGYERIVP